MKKICKLLALVGICAILFSTVTMVSATGGANSDNSLINGCHGIDAQVPFLGVEQKITNAEAVVLFENNSQTLMYAWNADEQLYPASFVKILTALIAIERGNLEDIVTIRKDVLDTIPNDAVSAELQVNEIMTLEDLLYCMLVSSANDAAAVIADHIAGSQAEFVTQMNLYAQELGCTGTNYTNVHGLHNPLQYTTARDTARILGVAMKNDTFREIFGTVRYVVEATNKSSPRTLETGNFLMNPDEIEIYLDPRVIGGRTGVTNDGDQCIAAASEKGGLQMISIIMGAKSSYEQDGYKIKSFGGFPETTDLLDLGFGDYEVTQLLYENQAIRQQSIPNGDADLIIAPQISISTIVPSGTKPEQLSYVYKDVAGLEAPVAKGQTVSVLEIWHGSLCLAQADLVAMNKVNVRQEEVQNVADNEPKNNQWSTVVLVIVLIVAALLVWALGSKLAAKLRNAAIGSRSRRYRRSRRRSR